MEPNQETLKQQLVTLSEQYPRLGNRLVQAAQQLKTLGTPLDQTLVDALITYSQTFNAVQQLLLNQGQTTATQATTVQELQNLAQTLSQPSGYQKTHQEALQILERVLSLTHTEQTDFAPLQMAQNQAHTLKQAISEKTSQLHPEAEALTTDNHPLAALVKLVEQQDTLDDNQWSILEEKIIAAFGKALGIAIFRRKIQLPPQPKTQPPQIIQAPAPQPQGAIPDLVILDEPNSPGGPEVIIVPAIDVSKLPTIDGKNIVFGNAPITGQSQSVNLSSSLNLKVLVHLQGLGDRIFSAQEYAGTRGQGRRLEAFQINFDPPVPGLNLRYMAHISRVGDTPMSPEGQLVGERGKNQQVEGFAIELTGPQAANYNVCYTAHIQNKGDVPICQNGQYCGTRGQGLRVEGIKVWVEAK